MISTNFLQVLSGYLKSLPSPLWACFFTSTDGT